MHSFPPVRTLKSQQVAEQPLPRGAGPTKKRYSTSKDKEEATVRQQEGHNHEKIKSQTHWSVTHKLENNNTKEVLLLLCRFRNPHQASQPGDLTKELGIPRESDLEGLQDLITRLLQD